MQGKQLIRLLTPPILIDFAKHFFLHKSHNPIEWEYMPNGWKSAESDPHIKGWNVQEVLESYKAKWPAFINSLEGTSPFGLSPESISSTERDLNFHNTILSYAYVLSLAARCKSSISMLDWGGGIGHYYLISKALIPNLHIDYYCRDVPILVEYGKKLFPDAHFYIDDTCFSQQYNLILASSSLHYVEDWPSTLGKMSKSTSGYLFITRLPTIYKSDSYVFIQRPYQYGYNTEYLGWCINRSEFIQHAKDVGLQLVREFVVGERPIIHRAPEQCEYRGYLFRPIV